MLGSYFTQVFLKYKTNVQNKTILSPLKLRFQWKEKINSMFFEQINACFKYVKQLNKQKYHYRLRGGQWEEKQEM